MPKGAPGIFFYESVTLQVSASNIAVIFEKSFE